MLQIRLLELDFGRLLHYVEKSVHLVLDRRARILVGGGAPHTVLSTVTRITSKQTRAPHKHNRYKLRAFTEALQVLSLDPKVATPSIQQAAFSHRSTTARNITGISNLLQATSALFLGMIRLFPLLRVRLLERDVFPVVRLADNIRQLSYGAAAPI